MIKIYNFPRGARGLRVMWQCEEMGLPYEFKPVTFPPSEAYRALNPLGNVPFLEDDGVAINESIAMVLYLAQKYGPTPLLPTKDAGALATVLQLTVMSEATLGGQMNPLMMAHFAAPEGEKRNWLVNTVEGRVEQALAFVEAKLGDKPFFVGQDLTLADICIATALGMWEGALKSRSLPSSPHSATACTPAPPINGRKRRWLRGGSSELYVASALGVETEIHPRVEIAQIRRVAPHRPL